MYIWLRNDSEVVHLQHNSGLTVVAYTPRAGAESFLSDVTRNDVIGITSGTPRVTSSRGAEITLQNDWLHIEIIKLRSAVPSWLRNAAPSLYGWSMGLFDSAADQLTS